MNGEVNKLLLSFLVVDVTRIYAVCKLMTQIQHEVFFSCDRRRGLRAKNAKQTQQQKQRQGPSSSTAFAAAERIAMDMQHVQMDHDDISEKTKYLLAAVTDSIENEGEGQTNKAIRRLRQNSNKESAAASEDPVFKRPSEMTSKEVAGGSQNCQGLDSIDKHYNDDFDGTRHCDDRLPGIDNQDLGRARSDGFSRSSSSMNARDSDVHCPPSGLSPGISSRASDRNSDDRPTERQVFADLVSKL